MANTLSSKKNIRVAERRTAINRSRKSRIKTFCRKVLEAIEKGDKETAKTDFVAFESEIMKGVTKGVPGIVKLPEPFLFLFFYLPMQNFEKILSRISSVLIWPVIFPIQKLASLIFSAIISIGCEKSIALKYSIHLINSFLYLSCVIFVFVYGVMFLDMKFSKISINLSTFFPFCI